MNRALVDRVADAVLYEGYILYPYRPSVKNRQRWTFGGLFPAAFCETSRNGDASGNQTECLIYGHPETAVEAVARFLHLTDRRVGGFDPSLAEWRPGAEVAAKEIESLRIDNKIYQPWQEAEKREVAVDEVALAELLDGPRQHLFSFPAARRVEPIRGPAGEVRGVLIREQRPLVGVIELSAAEVATGLFRVTIRVFNRTPWEPAAQARVLLDSLACAAGSPIELSRDDAQLSAFASTHVLLGVRGGEFVSLTDPPDCWRDAAAGCQNVGVWPVLAGEPGRRDMLLASPIILEDYPQIAPESPGDFFDGAEIDEMLTLRIMTLTDDEKRAMAAVDGRAGELLARTEAHAREQLLSLHGTVRDLRPASGGAADG